MKSKILGLLTAGLLAAPITGMTDPIPLEYGAYAGIFARDCSVAPGCQDRGDQTHSDTGSQVACGKRVRRLRQGGV